MTDKAHDLSGSANTSQSNSKEGRKEGRKAMEYSKECEAREIGLTLRAAGFRVGSTPYHRITVSPSDQGTVVRIKRLAASPVCAYDKVVMAKIADHLEERGYVIAPGSDPMTASIIAIDPLQAPGAVLDIPAPTDRKFLDINRKYYRQRP